MGFTRRAKHVRILPFRSTLREIYIHGFFEFRNYLLLSRQRYRSWVVHRPGAKIILFVWIIIKYPVSYLDLCANLRFILEMPDANVIKYWFNRMQNSVSIGISSSSRLWLLKRGRLKGKEIFAILRISSILDENRKHPLSKLVPNPSARCSSIHSWFLERPL